MTDVQSLDIRILEKIYNDGVENFNSTISDINDTRKRGFTILAIVLSILGVSVSTLIDGVENINGFDNSILKCVSFITLLILIWAIYKLIKVIYPKSRMIQGEEPKNINISAANKLEIDSQYLMFLINDIENVQGKITFNKLVLEKEVRIMEHVMMAVPVSLLVLLGVSLFVIL